MKFLVKIDSKRASLGANEEQIKRGSILTSDEHMNSSSYLNSTLHRSHSVAPGLLKLQTMRPSIIESTSPSQYTNDYWHSVSSQVAHLLSKHDDDHLQPVNVFRSRKTASNIREHQQMHSSHRAYLESLTQEKTSVFSQEDLSRIQARARNLHWLSSHEENPTALRPKEYYIKELP